MTAKTDGKSLENKSSVPQLLNASVDGSPLVGFTATLQMFVEDVHGKKVLRLFSCRGASAEVAMRNALDEAGVKIVNIGQNADIPKSE